MRKEYLLKLGQFNASKYIISESYDCYEEQESKTFTDANYTDHIILTRKRIAGKCTLLISLDSKMTEFLDAFKGATVNGVTTIDCWVNNIHTAKTIKAKVKTVKPMIAKNTLDTKFVEFDFQFEEV